MQCQNCIRMIDKRFFHIIHTYVEGWCKHGNYLILIISGKWLWKWRSLLSESVSPCFYMNAWPDWQNHVVHPHVTPQTKSNGQMSYKGPTLKTVMLLCDSYNSSIRFMLCNAQNKTNDFLKNDLSPTGISNSKVVPVIHSSHHKSI